jgi:hypothetical protein
MAFGRFSAQVAPADEPAFYFVFGVVDLAAGQTLIKDVQRGAAAA